MDTKKEAVMNYEVKIYEVVSHTVEVEAKSPDDAYNVAYDIISEGDESLFRTEAQGYTGEFDVYEIIETKK